MARDIRDPDDEVGRLRARSVAPPAPLVEAGLRDALRRRDVCPICAQGEESERRHFFWFLHENYHAPETLEELSRGGYCDRHLAYLLDHGDDRVTATCEFLLADDARRLDDLAEAAVRRASSRRQDREWARRLERGFVRRRGCPACRARRETEELSSQVLADRLADPGWRELLSASSGLCRTHAEAVLRVAPPEVAAWLVADLERRVRQWRAEIAAFFRTLDYRFAHEATGREKTVWRTVARYLWGARPG